MLNVFAIHKILQDLNTIFNLSKILLSDCRNLSKNFLVRSSKILKKTYKILIRS